MKRRAGRNADDRPETDCDTCIHRSGCERAASGSFCTQWQSQEPEDRGESPADAWARGEDSL